MNELRVKVADYAVARGDAVISTIGLGSCVAILLHDPLSQVGALAHVLLPNEAMSRDTENKAKFPGTAVPLLVSRLREHGARGLITARIVGGASMFGQLLPTGGINMGERNVEATRRALDVAGLRLVAEDVGGDYGRSVYLYVATGRVHVKSLRKGDSEL